MQRITKTARGGYLKGEMKDSPFCVVSLVKGVHNNPTGEKNRHLRPLAQILDWPLHSWKANPKILYISLLFVYGNKTTLYNM